VDFAVFGLGPFSDGSALKKFRVAVLNFLGKKAR
jgi:hypothetical protein